MASQETSPSRLATHLAFYFAVLIGLILTIMEFRPEALQYLPFGGADALSGAEVQDVQELVAPDTSGQELAESAPSSGKDRADNVGGIIFFLVGHLTGTIIVMIPITWTYKAIRYDVGFEKTFARALLILPICATTIVLLIQDSLPLAFGLAALVAAVRFRVTLDEAIDGIFIFAAVCVGLAAGIGYLGVAIVMGAFFCFTNLVLWKLDYGKNPVDDARRKKKRARLDMQEPDAGMPPQ